MSIWRTLVAAAAALVALPLLAGCAAPAGGAQSSLALVDTKPPTQLLRNELISRLPTEVVESLGESEDTSIACGQDGFKRSWRASQLVFVVPSQADGTVAAFAALVATLTDEGWSSEESKGSLKIHEARLTSAETTSVVLVTATEASDDRGNGAAIEVAVTGPCVLTDGPDSPEVMHLEGRG